MKVCVARSVPHQEVVSDVVVCDRAANGLQWATGWCGWAYGSFRRRTGNGGNGLRCWFLLRLLGRWDFDVNGIDEGGQRCLVLLVGMRPKPQNEADKDGRRDGDKPGRCMEMMLTAPGADAQLSVLFVTQLSGSADNVLIIDSHNVSVLF